MLLLVAALVVQLPALPEADPYAADTLPGWARAARAVLRNEPNVEYTWTGATTAHLELIRRLPDEAPGKQQYVEFLKETYGYNIDRLNAAYGLEASSFTDLYSFDYRALDRTRDAVRRDDAAFRRALNEMLVAEAAKITGRRIRLTE
jgi:hypothetical protein